MIRDSMRLAVRCVSQPISYLISNSGSDHLLIDEIVVASRRRGCTTVNRRRLDDDPYFLRRVLFERFRSHINYCN